MASTKSTNPPGLSLETLEGAQFTFTNPVDTTVGVKEEQNTHARKKVGRRVTGERREAVRFQEPRRAGDDRRAKKTWDPTGKNR